MSRAYDPAGILAQVKARDAALAACPGHTFVRDVEGRQGSKMWRCVACNQHADAIEVSWYLRGLRHGAQGHAEDKAVPR